jgi:hypothetical protein
MVTGYVREQEIEIGIAQIVVNAEGIEHRG